MLLLLTCSGCMVSQGSVGVGTRGGFGVVLSSYGDALFSSGSSYENNRRGVQELAEENYTGAEKTFQATLDKDPTNPDAVYYMGLTLIYLDKRETGYALMKTYRDPLRYRVTQAVQWWANYLEKKPELSPKKIHEVMNKNRMEAYNREYRERDDIRRDSWL